MGLKYLLDSNVIIDYFGDRLPQITGDIIENSEIFAASISQIEVLGFKMDAEIELNFLDFFSTVINFELDEQIINQSIQIRKFKKIKLGDAIIAATALVHDLTLITRNLNDFKGIEKLKILDSYQV